MLFKRSIVALNGAKALGEYVGSQFVVARAVGPCSAFFNLRDWLHPVVTKFLSVVTGFVTGAKFFKLCCKLLLLLYLSKVNNIIISGKVTKLQSYKCFVLCVKKQIILL